MAMHFEKLTTEDGSWDQLEADWRKQCEQVDEEYESYARSSVAAIHDISQANDPSQWALALTDGHQIRAIALGILARQKGFVGKVLRIREVTVCPLLDLGVLDEEEYIDTLISLLNSAVKLSESGLVAQHIKMHLRSPSDRVFFRAVGNTLDSKGVFAASEAQGAWLTFTKHLGHLQPLEQET